MFLRGKAVIIESAMAGPLMLNKTGRLHLCRGMTLSHAYVQQWLDLRPEGRMWRLPAF